MRVKLWTTVLLLLVTIPLVAWAAGRSQRVERMGRSEGYQPQSSTASTAYRAGLDGGEAVAGVGSSAGVGEVDGIGGWHLEQGRKEQR